MKPSDWDNPEIRAIGRRYAKEALNLADELDSFGADASALLDREYDPTRPRTISLPTMSADVSMAVLLTLPPPDWLPDQPLGENVTALRKRLSLPRTAA
jgi:hypothetical protein